MCNYLKIINIYTGAHLPRITPFANPILASVQKEKKRGENAPALLCAYNVPKT
jgi:hypothetical protein